MRYIVVPAILILSVFGCGDSETKPSEESQQAAAPDQAGVATIDTAGLRSLVAEHRGKVILINAWATWCMPCIKEFPVLDEFADDYRSQGVEVVAVSVDDAASHQAVVNFVADKKPSFRVVHLESKSDNPFRSVLGTSWSGALPATFIINRRGQLAKKLIGARDREELEAVVKPLLGGR